MSGIGIVYYVGDRHLLHADLDGRYACSGQPINDDDPGCTYFPEFFPFGSEDACPDCARVLRAKLESRKPLKVLWPTATAAVLLAFVCGQSLGSAWRLAGRQGGGIEAAFTLCLGVLAAIALAIAIETIGGVLVNTWRSRRWSR